MVRVSPGHRSERYLGAMDFHHVHFFVDDAHRWAQWFIKTLQFARIERTSQSIDEQVVTDTIWLRQGGVQVALSAPRCDRGPVAAYLRQQPPGVVDIAFVVSDLPTTLQALWQRGVELLQPIQRLLVGDQWLACAQVSGWAGLRHTLVQAQPAVERHAVAPWAAGIDHAVLNVPHGELGSAVAWYCQMFGFQPQQRFDIRTSTSGLHSRVLAHPQGDAQLPINEPSTANSQIQEFLVENRGAGVQHIALRTPNLIEAVQRLQASGLERLSVPQCYYEQLAGRPGYGAQPMDWCAVREHQLLADWPTTQPQALLLQTFTQPVFDQPTFFWELIERQRYQQAGRLQLAQGFGEGNFQALFEAVEREQRQRALSGVARQGD